MYYSVINGPELMELQNDSTVNVQAIKRTLMMVPMQKKKKKTGLGCTSRRHHSGLCTN